MKRPWYSMTSFNWVCITSSEEHQLHNKPAPTTIQIIKSLNSKTFCCSPDLYNVVSKLVKGLIREK